MKISLKSHHPQAIHDVDEFVFFMGTDLEKFSITSLINGSSAVNGCCQNESPDNS